MPCDPVHASEKEGSLLTLAVLALVVGAAAGLVGAVFRLTLVQADLLRSDRLGAGASRRRIRRPCDHMCYGNWPCRVAGPAVLTAGVGEWNVHFQAWREKQSNWIESKPERAAKALSRARALREQCISYKKIADTLKAENLRNLSGKLWTAENIRKLMANSS